MLKTLFSLIIAVSLSAFSYQAHAERTIEQIYKECGLGGALFGKHSPLLAILSNATWDLGTTAASSEMSSPETCITRRGIAAVFIKESIDFLETDISLGQGQYLSALSHIIACPSVDAQSIRSEYASLTTSADYADMSQQVKAEKLFQQVISQAQTNACSLS